MQLDTSLTKEEQKMQDVYDGELWEEKDVPPHNYFINSMSEESREEYYYDLRVQSLETWRKLS